jgi:rhodanese-related sulfurtransferase
MKTLPILILILLTSAAGAADTKAKTGSKKPSTPAAAPAKASGAIREISIEDTDNLIRKEPDITIIDVRSAEELQTLGYIKGAKNVDFLGDFEKQISSLGLDPAKPCIVYCAIGGRAKRAADKMVNLGFKQILMPAGSFNAWKSAGKPVEGGKVKP